MSQALLFKVSFRDAFIVKLLTGGAIGQKVFVRMYSFSSASTGHSQSDRSNRMIDELKPAAPERCAAKPTTHTETKSEKRHFRKKNEKA